jgi:histidinol-phosphatase (PHP family)
MGGKFTLSDDSHGIAQVATNYHRTLGFLENLGVGEVWTLERTPVVGGNKEVKAILTEKKVSLAEVRESLRLTDSMKAA